MVFSPSTRAAQYRNIKPMCAINDGMVASPRPEMGQGDIGFDPDSISFQPTTISNRGSPRRSNRHSSPESQSTKSVSKYQKESDLRLPTVHVEKRREKKSVHFAIDAQTKQVKCEYESNEPRPFPIDGSPDSLNPVWYCPTEFKLLKKDGQRQIVRDGGEESCKKEYMDFYNICNSLEGRRTIQWSRDFCSGNLRGLERMLFPKSKFCQKPNKSVLAAQEELRKEKNCTEEKKADVLAEFYKTKSAPARRIARIIAAGDEKVANELNGLKWKNRFSVLLKEVRWNCHDHHRSMLRRRDMKDISHLTWET